MCVNTTRFCLRSFSCVICRRTDWDLFTETGALEWLNDTKMTLQSSGELMSSILRSLRSHLCQLGAGTLLSDLRQEKLCLTLIVLYLRLHRTFWLVITSIISQSHAWKTVRNHANMWPPPRNLALRTRVVKGLTLPFVLFLHGRGQLRHFYSAYWQVLPKHRLSLFLSFLSWLPRIRNSRISVSIAS